MAIQFVPVRGTILICDFDLNRGFRVEPEIDKRRRVVVVSPRSYNRRHGVGARRCLVVPFSATKPKVFTPAVVHFPLGPYASFTKEAWALCHTLMAVSHERLDQVWRGLGTPLSEVLSKPDMVRIEAGLRHA